MNGISAVRLSKVPEVTLAFWVVKIAATTLGETGGDAVSMTMNLGYAIGRLDADRGGIFLKSRRASGQHPNHLQKMLCAS
jgi:uncharacterized membrane-anchored protein